MEDSHGRVETFGASRGGNRVTQERLSAIEKIVRPTFEVGVFYSWATNVWGIPSGKPTNNYGKIHHFY
jgi:hypothetical protein